VILQIKSRRTVETIVWPANIGVYVAFIGFIAIGTAAAKGVGRIKRKKTYG